MQPSESRVLFLRRQLASTCICLLLDLKRPQLTGGMDMRNDFQTHIYHTSDGNEKKDKNSPSMY